MTGDPREPSQPYARIAPVPIGPDWLPDPVAASPTRGVPWQGSIRPWWRLEPGERGDDGRMTRRSIIHGGTCARWRSGRHPPNWSFHPRDEVQRLLTRPDEVMPCPVCRPWIGL